MSPAAVLDADDLRSRVQAELDSVLASQAAVLAEVGVECDALVGAVARLVAGGKRLRPAFCWWGWRGAGGDPSAPGSAEDGDAVVRVATALELFQAAALIHDDVMDASETRRGMPATHRSFANLHAAEGWDGDADRFGAAGAILAGDLCLSWSDEVLRTAVLPVDRRRDAERVFDRMRTQLMGGQYLDMLAQAAPLRRVGAAAMAGAGGGRSDYDRAGYDRADDSSEAHGRADEAEALLQRARRVICFKSAKYSVEHPLLVGAALGGAPPALTEAYSAYGLALGEAFQLRDDVLGVFGDPAQTGKPAGDDLREGKRTVLVACALQTADPVQAGLVHRLLGDPELDADGVDALREVVVATGALARVEEMIEDGVRRSREALAAAPVTEPARAALDALVDAATARAA